MTKTQAINKLLVWLNAQVGYTEGSNNWNKYAADPRVTKLLGWNAQNQKWCDLFTDAAFIECFGLENAAKMTYQTIGKGSAKCSVSADYFKRNQSFFRTPEVGDIVFFYVDGDINHQGIAVDIDSGYVTAIEGNSSDRVSRNRYRINYPFIAGYGRPCWSVITSDNEPVTTPTEKPSVRSTTEIPVLKKGDKGKVVRSAQMLLIGRHFPCGSWGADGDFGTATEQAVKNAQTEYDLEVDGVIGAQTWAALLGI